jgi:hypothetical protein
MKLLSVLLMLLMPQVTVAANMAWDGKCDCTATLSASGDALSREALGEMPEQEDAVATLPIERRSNLTFEAYMTEYFSYGKPVIIQGATEGWPMLDLAGEGNPPDNNGDLTFKRWLVDTFGQEEHVESQREVQSDGTYVARDVLKGGKVYIDKALKQGIALGLPEGTADFTGLYEQLTSEDRGFDPFNGLWTLPAFLPFRDPGSKAVTYDDSFTEGSGGSAYVGGPPIGNKGLGGDKGQFFPRHQDWGSCLVGLQVQVRGSKRWRIQSALTATQLAAPPFAGVLGNKNVVYEGEVHPSEILIWPVQLFHETVGNSFSFAFQHHIAVLALRRVFRVRNGVDTFRVPAAQLLCSEVGAEESESDYCHQSDLNGAIVLPVNMFYQKLMAHFACNEQLRGWYCENSMCLDEWTGVDSSLLRGPVLGGAISEMHDYWKTMKQWIKWYWLV